MPRLKFLALALAPLLAACATTTIHAQFAYHLSSLAPDSDGTTRPSVVAGKAIVTGKETNLPFGCGGPDGLDPFAKIDLYVGSSPAQPFVCVPAQNGKVYLVAASDAGNFSQANFYPIGTHSLAAGASVKDGDGLNVTFDPALTAQHPPAGGLPGGLLGGYICSPFWNIAALPIPIHGVALYDVVVASPAPTASPSASPSPSPASSPSASPVSAVATPTASPSPR